MSESTTNYSNWLSVLGDPRYADSGKAILQYLKLTEDLESPVPYNVWSFLSCVAALCGDRIYLRHGPIGKMRLNLGVILSGAPALRKSTALTMMQRFAEGLPLYYGPTDTAGQRQGIMSAMMPRWQIDSAEDGVSEISMDSLEALANFDSDSILSTLPDPVSRKASEIYFVSKELGRLMGSQTRELLDFFTDGIDGESFHYQLKNQSIKINKPLINLIGATTPASLGQMMPRGAADHGFLSRLIFVHATSLTQATPIPKPWDDNQLMIRDSLQQLLLDQYGSIDTEISLTADAAKTYHDLYGYQVKTQDIRLMAYGGRRQGHMLKVAALLALLRGHSPIAVQASDMRLAHALLLLTEGFMDRAFYGLDTGLYSRVLCALCEIAESTSDGVFSLDMVYSQVGYMAQRETLNAMCVSLQDQKKIINDQSGTINSPNWRINSEGESLIRAELKGVFAKPAGIVEPDEFITHQTGIRLIQKEKKA